MHGLTVTLEELLALSTPAWQLHLPQNQKTCYRSQGGYTSPLRGKGVDFLENRVYQPGDDIRSINWPVTARTGKTHTKVYQQEPERAVYLILDFSPSLFFGTRTAFKSVVAAKAAAMIAWAALKSGDKIGALLIKSTQQTLLPSRNKADLIRLLKEIVMLTDFQDNTTTDVMTALKKFKQIVKSGSLIYFISDFYCLNQDLQTELQWLSTQHEVVNLLVYDTLEKNPPKQGRYLFRDHRFSQSILIDTHHDNICQQYQNIFAQRLATLKKMCFKSRMHLLQLATHEDIATILRPVLSRKKS